MAGAGRSRVDALLLAVLLFAQLLLMASSVRNDTGASLFERGVSAVSHPVVAVTRTLGGGIGSVLGGLRETRTARQENVRLRAELERVRSDLDRFREQALENRRLRQLLGMKEDLVPRSVGAAVITTHLASQSRTILLDRGESAGVRVDQAVVAWGGVVGRVVQVGKDYAKVRLLSDPNSGAAGLVQRSRAAGMVLGRGAGPLEMAYVPKYADVVVGDRVVTSGLDGVYPRGLGIGRVTLVADTARATKSIRLEPEVDFASLEDVLVLLSPVGSEILEPPPPRESK